MKYVKLLLLLLAIFLLQMAVVPNLSIKTAYPNLLFIGMLLFSLNFRFTEALVWGAISGLLFDIFSPFHFGIFTASFLALAIILRLVIKKFISEPILPIIVGLFFIGGLLFDLPIFLISGKNLALYFYVNLYNTIVGVILYYLLGDSLKIKESIYKL